MLWPPDVANEPEKVLLNHLKRLYEQFSESLSFVFPHDPAVDKNPLLGFPLYPIHLHSNRDIKDLSRKDVFRRYRDRDGDPNAPLDLPLTTPSGLDFTGTSEDNDPDGEVRLSEEADHQHPLRYLYRLWRLAPRKTGSDVEDYLPVALRNRFQLRRYTREIEKDIERYEQDMEALQAGYLGLKTTAPGGTEKAAFIVAGNGPRGRKCWWLYDLHPADPWNPDRHPPRGNHGPNHVGYFKHFDKWDVKGDASRLGAAREIRRPGGHADYSILEVKAIWRVTYRMKDYYGPDDAPSGEIRRSYTMSEDSARRRGWTLVKARGVAGKFRSDTSCTRFDGDIQLIRYNWATPRPWPDVDDRYVYEPKTALLAHIPRTQPPAAPTPTIEASPYNLVDKEIEPRKKAWRNKSLHKLGRTGKDFSQFAPYFVRAAVEDYIHERITPRFSDGVRYSTAPHETMKMLDVARRMCLNFFQKLLRYDSQKGWSRVWTPVSFVFSKVQGANYIASARPFRKEGKRVKKIDRIRDVMSNLSLYGPYKAPRRDKIKRLLAENDGLEGSGSRNREGYEAVTFDDLSLDRSDPEDRYLWEGVGTGPGMIQELYDGVRGARLHRIFVRTDLSREALSRALTGLAYLYMADMLDEEFPELGPYVPWWYFEQGSIPEPIRDVLRKKDLEQTQEARQARMEDIRRIIKPIVKNLRKSKGRRYRGPGSYVSYDPGKDAVRNGNLPPWMYGIAHIGAHLRGTDFWYVYLHYRIGALVGVPGFGGVARHYADKRKNRFGHTQVTFLTKILDIQKDANAEAGFLLSTLGLTAVGLFLAVGVFFAAAVIALLPFFLIAATAATTAAVVGYTGLVLYVAAFIWIMVNAYQTLMRIDVYRYNETYHSTNQTIDCADPVQFIDNLFPLKVEKGPDTSRDMVSRAYRQIRHCAMLDKKKVDPLVTAIKARKAKVQKKLFKGKAEPALRRLRDLAHSTDPNVSIERQWVLREKIKKHSGLWMLFKKLYVTAPRNLFLAPYGRFYETYGWDDFRKLKETDDPQERIDLENECHTVARKLVLLRKDLADNRLILGHANVKRKIPEKYFITSDHPQVADRKKRFRQRDYCVGSAWPKEEWAVYRQCEKQHPKKMRPVFWQGREHRLVTNPYKYHEQKGNDYWPNMGEACLARAIFNSAGVKFPEELAPCELFWDKDVC